MPNTTCTCQQTAADEMDPRGCSEHDPAEQRRLLAIALDAVADAAQDNIIEGTPETARNLTFTVLEAQDWGADAFDLECARARGVRAANTAPVEGEE